MLLRCTACSGPRAPACRRAAFLHCPAHCCGFRAPAAMQVPCRAGGSAPGIPSTPWPRGGSVGAAGTALPGWRHAEPLPACSRAPALPLLRSGSERPSCSRRCSPLVPRRAGGRGCAEYCFVRRMMKSAGGGRFLYLGLLGGKDSIWWGGGCGVPFDPATL